MSMHAPFWIARRFSFARKRFRVINIISAISFVGIVIGVTTLLVVMSVLNGFQRLALDLFLSLESPIEIVSEDGGAFTPDRQLSASLRTMEGVASAEPFVEGEAILAGSGRSELVMVRGVGERDRLRLAARAGEGAPRLADGSLSVGELLLYRLQLPLASPVSLFSPELVSLGLDALADPWLLPAIQIPRSRIGSAFSLQKLFDDRYVLCRDTFAREVLLMERDGCSGIGLRPKENAAVALIATRAERLLAGSPAGEGLRVRRIEEKYADIFAVMELEKWASFAVLMLIVMVASMSLTGALTMTAIDKQRDLFSLRCLGLERADFIGIFLLQGALTGVAGTLSGSLLAWGICSAQAAWGLVRLPSQSAFIIEAYPVSIEWGDFVAVSISAVLLCLLVSLWPARKAAQIARSRSLDMKTV